REEVGEYARIARVRAADRLLLPGRHQWIGAIDLIDRAIVHEEAAGRELCRCGVLLEHEVRVGLDVGVDVVLPQESSLVAPVLALQILLWRKIVGAGRRPRRSVAV